MANMAIIEEGLEKLGLEHDNIEEASKIPLFEGSTLSSLFATFLILNCCHIDGASNAFITKLLELLKKKISPALNTLLFSKYEASSTLNRFGLAYDVIDVCAKACILFRGNHANIEQCIKCGEPKYMQVGKSIAP